MIFHKITHIDEHTLVKPLILDYIEKMVCDPLRKDSTEYISKTDWGRNVKKDYLNYIAPFIRGKLLSTYKSMGVTNIQLNNWWFQQYKQNDIYDWHTHARTNFSNIYYLEFPEGSPKTEFIDPTDGKTIITFDVKEGDVLTVPAFYVHRSPKMLTSDIRKTVIVFNMEVHVIY